jgi:hypothetical protein
MADAGDNLKAWWDAWWKEDFTWAGLAKKAWPGWSVVDIDGVAFAAETESGKVYSAPEGEGAKRTRVRWANLQDYWRADVGSGRLRSDGDMGDELIAAPDGSTIFHRMHLPPAWRDGTATARPIGRITR